MPIMILMITQSLLLEGAQVLDFWVGPTILTPFPTARIFTFCPKKMSRYFLNISPAYQTQRLEYFSSFFRVSISDSRKKMEMLPDQISLHYSSQKADQNQNTTTLANTKKICGKMQNQFHYTFYWPQHYTKTD